MNDPSASTGRPEIARTDSGGSVPHMEKDRAEDKAKGQTGLPFKGTTRYKEKFLTMKERYEVVTAAQEKYKRELALANDKIKKLQNECNLLLDAVDIAVPGQPSLIHYLHKDPVETHYILLSTPIFGDASAAAAATTTTATTAPAPPPPPAEPLPPPPAPSRTVSQSSAPQTNGANGHI